jgi:hypothetical protein
VITDSFLHDAEIIISYIYLCEVHPWRSYILLFHSLPMQQPVKLSNNSLPTPNRTRMLPKLAVLYSFTNTESFLVCIPLHNTKTGNCNRIPEFNIHQLDKLTIAPTDWVLLNNYIKPSHEEVILDSATSLQSNLISILFKKGNLTAVPSGSAEGFEVPTIEETSISLYVQFQDTSILIETSSVAFLTCYIKPVLNFEMYIIPFQPTVWLALAITTSGIIAFTYCFIKLSKALRSIHFCPIFFYLSFLVEDCYSAPSLLWRNSAFKITAAIWSLTSLILVNCYISLMIMEVSSPLKGTQIKSFDDIRCPGQLNPFNSSGLNAYLFWASNYSNQLSLHHDSILHFVNDGFDSNHYETYLKNFQNSAETCFTLLSSPMYTLNSSMAIQHRPNPRIYLEFNNNMQNMPIVMDPSPDQTAYLERLTEYFSPQHRHYPNDPKFVEETQDYLTAAIEKEITECGSSIYSAERKELLREYSYLKVNYPRMRLYLGGDVFDPNGSQRTNWVFSGHGNPKIAQYFRQMFEAGIPNLLKELHFHIKYLVRRKGTDLIRLGIDDEITSVKMDGSIQTVFIIWSAGVAVSWFSIMIESRHIFNLNNSYLLYCKIVHSCFKGYFKVKHIFK